MINLKPWLTELEDIARGETIRVNHRDCEAGEDTRRRLYLTRPHGSPNVVLGYCHNCQDYGTWNGKAKGGPFRDFDMLTPEVKQIEFDVPNGLVPCGDEWPTEAHLWRMRVALSKEECNAFGIKYDPATHRTFVPQWDYLLSTGEPSVESHLCGYQLRTLDGRGPKYLTALEDRDTTPFTRIGSTGDILWLVEDLPSGIHLARLGQDSLVNYGIKNTPEILHVNPPNDMGVVWLDNDSDHVVETADRIRDTWELVSGKHIAVEHKWTDPKYCPDPVKKNVIRDWEAELER